MEGAMSGAVAASMADLASVMQKFCPEDEPVVDGGDDL
jgi:hypothetical protein